MRKSKPEAKSVADKPNAPRVFGVLPPHIKAVLAEAVKRHGTQGKVGELLGTSGAAVSLLLNDRYSANIDTMEQRIRGQFMAETVVCPVYGGLSKRKCLDFQALPFATTNPLRSALGSACPVCPNRKHSPSPQGESQ